MSVFARMIGRPEFTRFLIILTNFLWVGWSNIRLIAGQGASQIYDKEDYSTSGLDPIKHLLILLLRLETLSFPERSKAEG